MKASQPVADGSDRLRQSAFTLIELLVVMAVIAILAGLLLPAVGRAKSNARTIQCLNNQRQLQLGWHLYADENSDRLPGNVGIFSSGREPAIPGYPHSPNWLSGLMTYEPYTIDNSRYADATNSSLLVPGGYGSIGPYTRSAAVYKCPEDKSCMTIAGARYPRVRSVAANFCMNGADEGFEWAYRFLPYCIFRKTADIITLSPSRAFVVIDEHEDYIDGSSFGFGFYDWDAGLVKASWSSFPTSRHNGSATLSFADGHAEIKRWLDLKTKQPVKGKFVCCSPLEENSDARWLAERSTSRNPNFTPPPLP